MFKRDLEIVAIKAHSLGQNLSTVNDHGKILVVDDIITLFSSPSPINMNKYKEGKC